MLNAAIYGTGRWGQNLVNAVHGKSGKINVVTGIARDPDKYADFSRETGIPLTADFDAVLADDGVGAVLLATPHSLHAEHIKAVAGAGKHVFVEKPIALTKASAEDAAAACRDAGVTLAVGFGRRFQPAYLDMKARIGNGDIGDVLHIEAQHSGPTGYRTPKESWRAQRAENPAGGMAARGIHNLDIMISLVGEVASVFAQSDRRKIENDMDDTTSMLFKFKNGVTGGLSTLFATGNIWRMSVFGAAGWIEMRGEQMLVVSDLDNVIEEKTFDDVDILQAELEAFADAAQGGAAYPVSGEEAVHGIAVLEAVDRSAQTGAPQDVA